MKTKTWTNPFYGVSHFGEYGTRNYWSTIEDHGSFVTLLRWFPGCGFSPDQTTHDNLSDAKRLGERHTRRF